MATSPTSNAQNAQPVSDTEWLLNLVRNPLGIAAIVIAIVLLIGGYGAWRQGRLEAALNGYGPFAQPKLALTFSAKSPYDPLSFVGRGAQAGFWQWSPSGLSLTDEGRKYFDQDEGNFISHATAGQRRVKRISSSSAAGANRRIQFVYEWESVSPVAAALLNPPPRTGEEYIGDAELTPDAGGWSITSLQTPDYDQPLSQLQTIASGVLK